MLIRRLQLPNLHPQTCFINHVLMMINNIMKMIIMMIVFNADREK